MRLYGLRAVRASRTNVPGLRYRPLHPVVDKGIERFSKSGENGFELLSNVQLPMCGIESHRGLLAELTGMMCR
jgi:hypothetical protein